jgi:MFS superfamily sulfate permease-like transporter
VLERRFPAIQTHQTFRSSRGYVDSIVAAKENSARFGYAISPNRELVALGKQAAVVISRFAHLFPLTGTANFFSSFLGVTGTVPSFGAITRSRLNATVGARSQMASIVTSVIVILTALFLLPYFHFLPKVCQWHEAFRSCDTDNALFQAVLASIITLVS